jgi:hypothetical protein
MRISITHEAQQYIEEDGHSVIILLGRITGCCGGAAPMPQIELGSPKELSGYEHNIIGYINVFVDKSIDIETQIDISLGKLLWFKKLLVELA